MLSSFFETCLTVLEDQPKDKVGSKQGPSASGWCQRKQSSFLGNWNSHWSRKTWSPL